VSDNLGMRGVLDALSFIEAQHDAGLPSPLDHVRRIIVIVVNSLSSPPTSWDESEQAPGTAEVLLKSAGLPIDHYSFEAVETLKDTAARWRELRKVRELAQCPAQKDSPVCQAVRAPQAEIYAIDVSFAALKDKDRTMFDYLNSQPTTFVLPAEAVDSLRSAAGEIIAASPEFQRLLQDSGVKIVEAAAEAAGR
jgi:NTE family protein